MVNAIFLQYTCSGDSVPAGSIAATAFFCVAGIGGGPFEINCTFTIDPLDIPLQIKKKLCSALRDKVLADYAVTIEANDILVPDFSRGLFL